MIRILCLVSGMNAGGAETFLMKIYRCLDRSKYQMDFCVNVQEECFYDDEIKTLGGMIYHIPCKSDNIIEFTRELYNIVHDNGYKNVMRITSNGMGFYDIHVAKKAGAINCIVRSSNSSDGGGIKSWFVHRIGRLLFKRDIDIKIAPSSLAAVYTFGRADFDSNKVMILHNGIDFAEYSFSNQARIRVREEFKVGKDCFLIGHIGRFTEQKNHRFLIDVFSEINKAYPNTRLLLVGDGELKNTIDIKCKQLGISNGVIFTEARKNIPDILSSMDLLLFPSLYEGMPNVLIEAQASGLPCFVSDRITKEVLLTPLVKQLPIGSTKPWVSNIERVIGNYSITREEKLKERYHQKLPEEYDIHRVSDSFVSCLI